jgi:hypothetical protein
MEVEDFNLGDTFSFYKIDCFCYSKSKIRNGFYKVFLIKERKIITFFNFDDSTIRKSVLLIEKKYK